jgi:hypothetical protein
MLFYLQHTSFHSDGRTDLTAFGDVQDCHLLTCKPITCDILRQEIKNKLKKNKFFR